ncbi:MAG: NAD(P)H-hydrate dehydratase [Hyphomicrobiales bacterium]|nr:NAD(P)H-hydrate dehydratase [Hyphomicrobiales bacterium]
MTGPELLTVDEMYRADALAMAGGVPGNDLMEAAGGAVAGEIRARWTPRPVGVLCGPGNNGGDGFVIARLLADEGWPVRLMLLGDAAALQGDAAVNRDRWHGPIETLAADGLDGCELVVDALFGAGLARALGGVAAEAVDEIGRRGLPCVAVDVPSGLHGDSGAVLGTAARAAVTVTFFRAKPGHFLYPGADLVGDLVVADIGIPAAVLDDIAPRTFANGPALWRRDLPRLRAADHKYNRGHAVVLGGAVMTGAARLAAHGARRLGAGLLTIAAPGGSGAVYRAGQPGVIVADLADDGAFAGLLADGRKNAVLLGPGAGVRRPTRARVLEALATGKAVVLDADALTSFEREAEALFAAIEGPCVLTPHEGEFARLFEADGDKVARARAAAARSGAVVLLKGPDTVIAAPDGRAAVNGNAPPTLATGGSGDVLAGFVLGLLAQGMAPFAAACAATWIHGDCAARFGPGLLAEDLPGLVPAALADLYRNP